MSCPTHPEYDPSEGPPIFDKGLGRCLGCVWAWADSLEAVNTKLVEEKRELERQLADARYQYRHHKKAVDARCKRLEEALRFYADPATYMIWINHPDTKSTIVKDTGKIARAALAEGKGDCDENL